MNRRGIDFVLDVNHDWLMEKNRLDFLKIGLKLWITDKLLNAVKDYRWDG